MFRSVSIWLETESSSSSGETSATARPKPAESWYDGCALIATKRRSARRVAFRIDRSSPAWPPQAMFTLATYSMSGSSSKPSPPSKLRSTANRGFLR